MIFLRDFKFECPTLIRLCELAHAAFLFRLKQLGGHKLAWNCRVFIVWLLVLIISFIPDENAQEKMKLHPGKDKQNFNDDSPTAKTCLCFIR